MTEQRSATGQPRSSFRSVLDSIEALVDRALNWVFALTDNAAVTRSRLLRMLILLMWLGMAFNVIGIEKIRELAGAILIAYSKNDATGTLNNVTILILSTFLNPVVVRHLIILTVPFLLIHRAAAAYLADIFEFEEKDIAVAEKFIMQAAFGSKYNTIHIREGKIIEADLKSPMVLIGGPGYVVVELDSAVLFERPDGSYHILGPTNKEFGKEVITGFERVRGIVDLRDVNEGQTVAARSRDGIPVTAKDIQYSFSIYRGPKPVKKDLKTPYPFDEESIQTLVYTSPRPVKCDETPIYKPDWSTPLPGRIAGQINGDVATFVNKLGLSQFLANTGTPEQDNLATHEKNVDQESRHLSDLNGNGSISAPTPVVDAFTARTEMTAKLYLTFEERAAKKGVYLNWIGVGTWDTPAEIIPAKHLQAWKLSRDNDVRGAPEEIARLKADIKLEELLRLVQIMPIGKVNIQTEETIDEEKIKLLLTDYLSLLERARDLYRRDEPKIPDDLSEAIQILGDILYPRHHHV